MSSPSRRVVAYQPCCASVYKPGAFRALGCNKPAKVERDGKWYCGVHDPKRRKQKDDARRAKWNHETAVLRARQAVMQVRNEAADLIERGNVTKAEFAEAQAKIARARAALAALEVQE
jgi:uncharacterized Zn finger protein (UPF0148 family)